jgi:predicted HTH transcriptional regulator
MSDDAEVVALLREIRDILAGDGNRNRPGGGKSQLQAVQLAKTYGLITVGSLRSALSCSKQRAHQILASCVARGLLVRDGEKYVAGEAAQW